MKKRITILTMVVLALLLAVGVLFAQTGSYRLDWWTVDGGGGHLSGTGYSLDGTIGQPDAGRMSGGGYVLAGGFWGGDRSETPSGHRVYLPTIVGQ